MNTKSEMKTICTNNKTYAHTNHFGQWSAMNSSGNCSLFIYFCLSMPATNATSYKSSNSAIRFKSRTAYSWSIGIVCLDFSHWPTLRLFIQFKICSDNGNVSFFFLNNNVKLMQILSASVFLLTPTRMTSEILINKQNVKTNDRPNRCEVGHSRFHRSLLVMYCIYVRVE